MKHFRSHFFCRLWSLLMGIVFLNMSFILTELSVVNLNKNKQVIANIVKLATTATEEERDLEDTSESSENLKEVDLTLFKSSFACRGINSKKHSSHLLPGMGFHAEAALEILSPPPESLV